MVPVGGPRGGAKICTAPANIYLRKVGGAETKMELEQGWCWEMLWFGAVTIALHAVVVGVLGGALALVEKYGLFQSSKIQTKVRAASLLNGYYRKLQNKALH